ncbi:MAG: DoxX family protein [Phycisphaerales bacterium JB060]
MPNPTHRSSGLPTVHSGKQCLVASWIGQIIVALILGQTLFFKFTNAPETQMIFEDLGGRPAAIASGVFEFIVVVLILIPRTAFLGALGGLLMMLGAIGSHLTILGIAIPTPDGGDDGGLLFGMAVIVLLMSALVAVLRRRSAMRLIGRG